MFAMTSTFTKECQVGLTSKHLHFCLLLFLLVGRCPADDVHKNLPAIAMKMLLLFQQRLNLASEKFILTRKF